MIKKILAVLILAGIISVVLISAYESNFDQTEWETYPLKRHKMVDNLIESQVLIGKTKDEVVGLLGLPNTSTTKGKDIFLYILGQAPSFIKSEQEQLLIVFEDQTVSNVSLAIE